ncbi:MAG: signal peptidase II [Treponemataceae bacterium]
MEKKLMRKILPFSLSLFIIFLDQITKFIVIKTISPYSIGSSFFGDFFRIIHVYNPGIAFSIGTNLPDTARSILFSILPILVIIFIIISYFKTDEFTYVQSWFVAGIIGGGIGNLIDRVFRKEGVVDFFDVKFYGLFGFDRWPTFNIADMSVVICGFLLLISFIRTSFLTKNKT